MARRTQAERQASMKRSPAAQRSHDAMLANVARQDAKSDANKTAKDSWSGSSGSQVKIGNTTYGGGKNKDGNYESEQQIYERITKNSPGQKYIAGKGAVVYRDKPNSKGQYIGTLGHLSDSEARDGSTNQNQMVRDYYDNPDSYNFKEDGRAVYSGDGTHTKDLSPHTKLRSLAQGDDRTASEVIQAQQAEPVTKTTPELTTEANMDVVESLKGADALTIQKAIEDGVIRADSKDATWKAMYEGGSATPAMVEAHNNFQSSLQGDSIQTVDGETTVPGAENIVAPKDSLTKMLTDEGVIEKPTVDSLIMSMLIK